ncbi:fatty acid desaturase family protein [Streptomyces clavifer]|uniref:fatty acid desaturase family protein n=1 Tax=Streptomyces clavifer TaxID=68188 RepID=UPI0036CDD1B0
MRWIDFRKTLKPHYRAVWRDIALCYIFLALGMAVAAAWDLYVTVPVIAIWTGYWLHALFLFGHEAAHSNLAKRRRANDRLGDGFVWLWFGSSTIEYRRTHMTHHSHLGDHHDTETTYHLCLSALNIVKAFTGFRVLEVLVRQRRMKRSHPVREEVEKPWREIVVSLRSLALHLAIIAALVVGHRYAALVAWLIGVGCVFPLCATVRTIVEHRKIDASCSVDFTVVEHGPINRLFGTDIFSSTFGAAGFNRHLLHHWDPAISYTRFEDMARFLERTPLAVEMSASRIGYGTAMWQMMVEARRA